LPLPLAAQVDAEGADGLPAIAASPNVIAHIEFSGNRVTQPQIMLQEMLVKEGDVADPALIERSRQAIMDLGLFVSVHAAVEPGADGLVLRIIVKEKYYILRCRSSIVMMTTKSASVPKSVSIMLLGSINNSKSSTKRKKPRD